MAIRWCRLFVVREPKSGLPADGRKQTPGVISDYEPLDSGFTAGDILKIPLNLPLIKGCSIVGVWIGAFAKRDPARHRANAAEIWKWVAEGKLKPHVSGRYPLERAADALNALAGRKVAGKVVSEPTPQGATGIR